ncbi:MAG TPA: Lrp/AsnC family transcriptional regulator [Kofleriaceae bacterium]|nr:Lrp/AsnC family transcriptional regulator [Kofleriaceae bacterium]
MRKRTPPAPLDRIDCGILAALQENARLSNKELAVRVGLSQSSCLERVRRLEARGVLRGFHADVDPQALGITLEAICAVRLALHARDEFEHFFSYVAELPEVIDVYELAGVNDYLVHVVVRDADHLRELMHEQISARPEVAHLETALVFRHAARKTLPQYLEPEESGG